MSTKHSKRFNFIIITVFIVALSTNAFNGSGGMKGVEVLFYGIFSIFLFHLFAFLSWFANVFLLISLKIRKTEIDRKLYLNGLSIVFGLLAILIDEIPIHMGSTTSAVTLGIGFYFWIGGMCLLFVKNLMGYRLSIRNKSN